MTRESILAACEIDQFPPYIRERILLAVRRLVELYLLMAPPRQTELPLAAPPPAADPNVIVLSDRRRLAHERRETKSS